MKKTILIAFAICLSASLFAQKTIDTAHVIKLHVNECFYSQQQLQLATVKLHKLKLYVADVDTLESYFNNAMFTINRRLMGLQDSLNKTKK